MTTILLLSTSLIIFIIGIFIGFSLADERVQEKNFEMKKLSYNDVKTLHVMARSIQNELDFNHLQRIENFIGEYEKLVKRVYKD